MDDNLAVDSDAAFYSLLEATLEEILARIKPGPDDIVRRFQTLRDIRFVVQSLPGLQGATVKPFGSYCADLFTKWGDVDISIQLSQAPFSVARSAKQEILRDMMIALSQTGWGYSAFIPRARVPILMFHSTMRNIACDISIDNHWGLVKSKILHLISNIDGRYRDMVLLIKEWAKAHNVNDPKKGTLSSYSICLLVIFHFQTCNPAIFPPLAEIYGGNLLMDFMGMRFSSLQEVENLCMANIWRITPMLGQNKSSLRELLVSFFGKFSRMLHLSYNYGICTYTGRYEGLNYLVPFAASPQKLIIEDPFERPENAGRSLSNLGLYVVSEAFAETMRNLATPSLMSSKKAILKLMLSDCALRHE